MNVLDLFSGIGGFSLGLERAGMKTVAFCEIDPFCRKVLRKHWSNVPIHEDVTKLTADDITEPVDLICGGFPCQDISVIGPGSGLAGERSGLWREFARLIGEIRPRYVIVENVAAMLSRGMGVVFSDLATLGYDAEWENIPACALGASHRRERIWIVAYAIERRRGRMEACFTGRPAIKHTQSMEKNFARPKIYGSNNIQVSLEQLYGDGSGGTIRNDDGISEGLDRVKSVGNAVVPQIPEMIGRAIMEQHS